MPWKIYACEKAYRVKRKEDFTSFINKHKTRPCADCGGKFDPICMDFDHRDPTKKEFNVSQMRKGCQSLKRIINEIEKCDVVCANCHRLRTREQNKKGIFFIGFKRANEDQLTFLWRNLQPKLKEGEKMSKNKSTPATTSRSAAQQMPQMQDINIQVRICATGTTGSTIPSLARSPSEQSGCRW